MVEQIIIVILSCIVSALVTWFLKTAFTNREIKIHEKECDKNRRLAVVETKFDEGVKRFEQIEKALVWIIVKMDGNPSDVLGIK